MKLNIKRIFFYLLPHIKKHWISCSLVFLGYTVGLIAESFIKPYIYKELVDLLASGSAREVIFNQAMNLVGVLIICIAVQFVGFRGAGFAETHFESHMIKRLYDFSFNKILAQSYRFFSDNFSGSIIARSKRFSRSFETFFDVVSYQIYFSIITLIGTLVVFFIQAPKIAYIFLIWSIFYILITILFIRKKIKYDLLEAEADSRVTASLADTILNILNVKIFSASKKERESFSDVTTDESKKRTKAWNLAQWQNVTQSFLMGVLQVLLFWVAVRMWYRGEITIGTIVLLQVFIINLIEILWSLGRSLVKAVKSLTDMQEVVDTFDLVPDILDLQNPEELKMKDGLVKFNTVNFSYKDGNPVLENLNLEIKSGAHVGLVGHSGAGKSTITKLLLRFADTTNGEITIDGQNVKNVTQDDLRSFISYVPQDPMLFHRTIKENIGYSKIGATEEEIIAVAKAAYAHDFIIKLPKGYDTLVGERGVKLSGGERQRVAIARAMLKNSPILVLDEATSSLDSVSEDYIQKAFVELMKGKTTIVIAHRLSTIQKMDRIIVLEDGGIAEDGTHSELLNKGGIYAELWNHQTGGFINE